MIKILSVVASILTFSYLTSDYIEGQQEQSSSASELAEYSAREPQRAPEQLLPIEKQWLDAHAERIAKKNQTEIAKVKPIDAKKKLMIGEQAYVLYGIFSNPKQPFVLLKDESDAFIKLKLGEQLNKETTLVALQSNNIAFERNNERIEFKLFERK